MSFKRYEVRWHYLEDNSMTYVAFDTIAEAGAYILENADTCVSDDNVNCAVYEVTLFSNGESTKLLRQL